MRILLKTVLDCPPDAAWAALTSPDGLRAVSAPLMSVESLEPGGFAERWTEGEHRVRLRLLGVAPAGEQLIKLSLTESRGIRILRDSGRPLTGPLAMLTDWEHTMAVTATADGHTLYRDRLRIRAGLLTPVLWVGFWAFWQWRELRMKRLAPAWAASLASRGAA